MGFAILVSVTDEKAETSTSTFNLPSTVGFSDAVLWAQQAASLVDAVIGGAITRVGIAFQVTLPGGIKATAQAESDVEEGVRFQFRTDLGHFTGLRLPTFLETLIGTGSRDVDLLDPDVAAFNAAMINGINLVPVGGSGVISPSDARNEDITALSYARESFQTSRG